MADLVVTADFLDIPDIVEECSAFMCPRVAADNVAEVWQFAQLYRMDNLQEVCKRCLSISSNFIFFATHTGKHFERCDVSI